MQARHAAPDDHVAWRRVIFAGKVAAKHGDLPQIGGELGHFEARSRSERVDQIERSDLGRGENAVGRGIWLGAR